MSRQVIDDLSVLSNVPQKTLEINGEDVRIEEIIHEHQTGNYRASFVKLRPMEKIGIYNYGGGKREIPLLDDEFVGEEVSFYYVPSLKVLVLQRNKYSISSTGVEKYFRFFIQDESFELRPIFTIDTYKKLLKHKVITSIETNISIPDDSIMNGEIAGWAFGDIQKLREKLGALKIGVTLTVENSKKSNLDFKTAIKFVKEIIDYKRANKLKAKVRKGEGEKLEELDLFQDLIRVTYFRTIEAGKTLSIDVLQRMAVEAYNEKSDELKQLFAERMEEGYN